MGSSITKYEKDTYIKHYINNITKYNDINQYILTLINQCGLYINLDYLKEINIHIVRCNIWKDKTRKYKIANYYKTTDSLSYASFNNNILVSHIAINKQNDSFETKYKKYFPNEKTQISANFTKHFFMFKEYDLNMTQPKKEIIKKDNVMIYYLSRHLDNTIKLLFTKDNDNIFLIEYDNNNQLIYQVINDVYKFYNNNKLFCKVTCRNDEQIIEYIKYYPSGNVQSESIVKPDFKKTINYDDFDKTITKPDFDKRVIKNIISYNRQPIRYNIMNLFYNNSSNSSLHLETLNNYAYFMFEPIKQTNNGESD